MCNCYSRVKTLNKNQSRPCWDTRYFLAIAFLRCNTSLSLFLPTYTSFVLQFLPSFLPSFRPSVFSFLLYLCQTTHSYSSFKCAYSYLFVSFTRPLQRVTAQQNSNIEKLFQIHFLQNNPLPSVQFYVANPFCFFIQEFIRYIYRPSVTFEYKAENFILLLYSAVLFFFVLTLPAKLGT